MGHDQRRLVIISRHLGATTVLRHRPAPSLRLVRLALVDVVLADDIVFAEIAADLHFDHFQRHLPRIFELVPLRRRDVDRLVLADELALAVRTTLAVPLTTIQCSERWWCICSESCAPGFTCSSLT